MNLCFNLPYMALRLAGTLYKSIGKEIRKFPFTKCSFVKNKSINDTSCVVYVTFHVESVFLMKLYSVEFSRKAKNFFLDLHKFLLVSKNQQQPETCASHGCTAIF